MNPAYYIPILLLLFVLYVSVRNQRMMVRNIINKNREENSEMIELAKRFVEKDCIIYTFNGTQIEGIIKEVSDGALLVDKKGTLEAVNISFVVRIREYPLNKNGKKKSVVVD